MSALRSTPMVVVLVAHGSRNPSANDAHRELVKAVDERVDESVVPAFLELAEPSIPETIDAEVAAGHLGVHVLPYFLHPGRHLMSDLPRIVAEAQSRHPAAEITLLESFGSDPHLVDLLVDQVRGAP